MLQPTVTFGVRMGAPQVVVYANSASRRQNSLNGLPPQPRLHGGPEWVTNSPIQAARQRECLRIKGQNVLKGDVAALQQLANPPNVIVIRNAKRHCWRPKAVRTSLSRSANVQFE